MEESITGSPGGLVMSGIENSLLQPVHLLFRLIRNQLYVGSSATGAV
jgi:hypothetical protein